MDPTVERKLDRIVRLLEIAVVLLGLLIVAQVGADGFAESILVALAVGLLITAFGSIVTGRRPVDE